MFGRPDKNAIDELIASVISDMEYEDTASEKYQDLLAKLERLTALREKKQQRIDPNTLVMVGGQLLGVLLVVMYEQKHVMTTKAFTLFKPNR